MLRIFTNEETKPVDRLIDVLLDKMHETDVSSDEYSTMMSNLQKLYAIKTDSRREPVKPDTIAIIAGNLLGILLIVAYEQKHVMTSKGFSQIIRPK